MIRLIGKVGRVIGGTEIVAGIGSTGIQEGAGGVGMRGGIRVESIREGIERDLSQENMRNGLIIGRSRKGNFFKRNKTKRRMWKLLRNPWLKKHLAKIIMIKTNKTLPQKREK